MAKHVLNKNKRKGRSVEDADNEMLRSMGVKLVPTPVPKKPKPKKPKTKSFFDRIFGR